MTFLHNFNYFIRNLAATILITSIITTPLAYSKPTAIVPSTHQAQSNQSQSSHHIQAERFIAKTNVVDLRTLVKISVKLKEKVVWLPDLIGRATRLYLFCTLFHKRTCDSFVE